MPMSAAPRRRAWRRPRRRLAQLDKILPLDDRKKGVAIAMAKRESARRAPQAAPTGQSRRRRPARSQRRRPSARRRQAVARPARAAAHAGNAAAGGSSSAPSRNAASAEALFQKLPARRARRPPALLYSGRRGHPPAGRAVRQPRRRAAPPAARSRQACFPVPRNKRALKSPRNAEPVAPADALHPQQARRARDA